MKCYLFGLVLHVMHQKTSCKLCTCFRWSVTLKAMCKGHPDVAILQRRTSQQLEEQLPAVASVAAPACLVSAAQLHQELFLVLEVILLPGIDSTTVLTKTQQN
jgi:hypothetical protein